MSLNCVSPYSDGSSPIVETGDRRHQYRPLEKQENIIKRNNNADRSSGGSGSPFHPLQLHPLQQKPHSDYEQETTPSPRCTNNIKNKNNNNNRYTSSYYSQTDLDSFQDEQSYYYSSDRSSTAIHAISPSPGATDHSTTTASRSGGSSYRTMTPASSRAPTPTVNNTSTIRMRSISFASATTPPPSTGGTKATAPNTTTTDQSSSLMSTSNTMMDQSSLMNTMNLISDDSRSGSSNDDNNESDYESCSSSQGQISAALRSPSPRDPPETLRRQQQQQQQQRRSKRDKQTRQPSQPQQFPYEKGIVTSVRKTNNKRKSNNNRDVEEGDGIQQLPNYYHPAYWDQRLARREVFSRRYRPTPVEREELNEIEEFLGIPEARKSRRTILVQQWRLLNPSTSQASNQNIPMSIVLKRGPVTWGAHEECELILLTRGLAIARKVFQYIPRFQLGEVWTNVERVISTGLTTFSIECKDKSLEFTCPTASDQQAWLNALRIVVLQAYMHHASLLDMDNNNDDDGANAQQFQEGWQYKLVQTPWFTEAVTGQVRLESNMLDQMDNSTLNELDSYNQYAPLHYATRADHVDAMRFLLQAGADPNLPDGLGRTAMHYAEEDKLPKSSIELLQSYGGKGTNPNRSCLQITPVKNTSRRCRLLVMAILFLLIVATGVTTFLIWFLGKDDTNSANGISSQESSSSATTQEEGDEVEAVNDGSEEEPDSAPSSSLSSSSSPPPFLVVGVNPIPATNLNISSIPDGDLTTMPTMGPVDAQANEPGNILDSLTELILNQTDAIVEGSLPEDMTLSPTMAIPEDADTPMPTSPSTASLPTSMLSSRRTPSPTFPTFEGSDFLPLTTESPTFIVNQLETTAEPSAVPNNEFTSAELIFQPTESPTFVATERPTTLAPSDMPTFAVTEKPTTFAPTNMPTFAVTEKPATLAPTNAPTSFPLDTEAPTWTKTESPTTYTPSLRPTESPTAAPTSTPTTNPTTFSPSSSPTSLPTTDPIEPPQPPAPTNFPTFASIHESDFLPEDTMLFEFLVENSFDNGASLHNPKSPQYRAFRWLSGNMQLTSYSDERKIQRYALATIFYSTGGEGWSNNRYWLSDEDECTMWFSRIAEVVNNAVCNSQGQMITLDLDYNNLRGGLPREVGQLSHLRRMELYGGPQWFLSGTLPSEVGVLQDLESLSVRGNRMTGVIPTELGTCSALSNLNLSQNRFFGPLPSTLGLLPHLQSMALETNRLTGSLPTQLAQARSLRSITLGANSLTGNIFTEIGMLRGLQGFDLDMNRLLTTIPSQMGLLANLTLFHMTNGGLFGALPWEMGSMTSLQSLQLRGNALESSIPSSVGQLTSLGALDMSFNELSGIIPSELGRATLLRSLLLNSNKLSGNVPSELEFLRRLNHIRVDLNDLTGTVPVEVCDVFFNTYPMFYADCFEVACPCCSYCCVDGENCDCVYAGTVDEFLC